jgi:hypothetical protein
MAQVVSLEFSLQYCKNKQTSNKNPWTEERIKQTVASAGKGQSTWDSHTWIEEM